MPEIIEILLYMRCIVTCQIVLIVHYPKKKQRKQKERKIKREFFHHSMYMYIQEHMCSIPITLLHIRYLCTYSTFPLM